MFNAWMITLFLTLCLGVIIGMITQKIIDRDE